MKKIGIVITALILITSCGEDKQAKVCECSKLYDELYETAEKLESEGMGGIDAIEKAREENSDKHEDCEKFHKELGDEEFHKMSKECK